MNKQITYKLSLDPPDLSTGASVYIGLVDQGNTDSERVGTTIQATHISYRWRWIPQAQYPYSGFLRIIWVHWLIDKPTTGQISDILDTSFLSDTALRSVDLPYYPLNSSQRNKYDILYDHTMQTSNTTAFQYLPFSLKDEGQFQCNHTVQYITESETLGLVTIYWCFSENTLSAIRGTATLTFNDV